MPGGPILFAKVVSNKRETKQGYVTLQDDEKTVSIMSFDRT